LNFVKPKTGVLPILAGSTPGIRFRSALITIRANKVFLIYSSSTMTGFNRIKGLAPIHADVKIFSYVL
jgi:hypothetical protein